ncbi:MAG: flagellar biosynthesis repressor FlbT [Pseudomonadota bacterium]
MALKIELKEGEKVVVNGAVFAVRPRGKGADLLILNQAKILRAREIIKEEDVDCIEKKLYFTIQLLYLFPEDSDRAAETMPKLMDDLRASRPEFSEQTDQIGRFLNEGRLYNALKLAGKLVKGHLPEVA